MVDSDYNDFERIWAHLSEIYGKHQPSQTTMKIIFNSLSTYPLEHIRRAASYYVRTGKFMPRPADIAEIIVGSANEQARAAFVVAAESADRIGSWRSVKFSDDNIMCVIYALGGWAEFCHQLKNNRVQTESRFVKWHEAAQHTPKKIFPPFLQGIDTTDKKKITEVNCNDTVCGLLALS